MRDSEKVEQLVLKALHLLQDAAAFEGAISDHDRRLMELSIKTVETLYESLPSAEQPDPNDNKYTCQPYGVAKCPHCLYPHDGCRCESLC